MEDRGFTRAPVLVVGTGRCGSSVLSQMLRLHPSVLSLSELWSALGERVLGAQAPSGEEWWSALTVAQGHTAVGLRHGLVPEEALYPFGRGRRCPADVAPVALVALSHLSTDPDGLLEELEPEVRPAGREPVRRHFLRLALALQRRFGGELWAERSGGSLAYLGPLLAMFPEARVIHIFRDGRRCALSMSGHPAYRLRMFAYLMRRYIRADPYESPPEALASALAAGRPLPEALQRLLPDRFDVSAFWDHPIPLEHFGRVWSAMVLRAQPLLERLAPGRLLALRYEDLVSQPERWAQAIGAFVAPGVRPHGWEARAAALVQPSRSDALEALAAAERRRLDSACRLGMEVLYGSGSYAAPVARG